MRAARCWRQDRGAVRHRPRGGGQLRAAGGATGHAAMSQDLRRLFDARAMALVGASEKSMWTKLMLDNHRSYGFESRLHLVHPRGETVFGQVAAPSCAAIEDSIDVAYVAVPRVAILDALADVAAAGIPFAMILSSGYAEVGDAGRRDQDALVAFARARGVTLLGPNCLGFVNLARRTGVTAMVPMLPIVHGGIAIVSQSGSSTGEMMNFAQQQGAGCCFAMAMGNEAMVDCAAVMEHLIDMPEAKCIVMFLETIRDPQAFVAAAARARAAAKPIVLLKLGRNALSSAVAQSHTGAMVGDDRMFDAMCRRHGLIRVPTVEYAIATAQVLVATGPLKKTGIAVVSISGGACGLLADLAQDHGVELPPFAAQTQQELRALMSDYGAMHNPFDVTGAAVQNPEMYAQILAAVSRDPSIGLVAAVNNLPVSAAHDHSPAVRAAIVRGLQQGACAGGIVSQCLRPMGDYARQIVQRESIPFVVGGFEHALRAFANVAWWSAQLRSAPHGTAAPVVADDGTAGNTAAQPGSERETLDYLRGFGIPVIPVRLARSAGDAVAAAEALACAVALKIASPDVAHKTEAGGVRLDVQGKEAVAHAYEDILAAVRSYAPQARIDGVLIAPMRSRPLELLVGTHRDPQWGPAILVGLGGIWAEALKDTSMRMLPITESEAIEMLESLRAAPLFKGFRGAPATDLQAVARVVVRIAEAALALGPGLDSLEVNPLVIDGSRVEVLDALAVWRRTDAVSNAH
jgi:acyl-CoA synthetase (NDP forming)